MNLLEASFEKRTSRCRRIIAPPTFLSREDVRRDLPEPRMHIADELEEGLEGVLLVTGLVRLEPFTVVVVLEVLEEGEGPAREHRDRQGTTH